jgi:hypothetical protein
MSSIEDAVRPAHGAGPARDAGLAGTEGIRVIASLWIGVGAGALSWPTVRTIAERVFGDCAGRLVVYEEHGPAESGAKAKQADAKAVDKFGTGRADSFYLHDGRFVKQAGWIANNEAARKASAM